MRSWWQTLDLIEQSRWALIEELKKLKEPEFDAHLGLADEFKRQVRTDVARLDLLGEAKAFPNATPSDLALFAQAVEAIELRVARYLQAQGDPLSQGGLGDLLQSLLARLGAKPPGAKTDMGRIEADATSRAIVLERALSQGIPREEAAAQELKRWGG